MTVEQVHLQQGAFHELSWGNLPVRLTTQQRVSTSPNAPPRKANFHAA
jgi:hypothetical protein